MRKVSLTKEHICNIPPYHTKTISIDALLLKISMQYIYQIDQIPKTDMRKVSLTN